MAVMNGGQGSGGFDRVLQVFADIAGVFQSHRQPQQAGGHAQFFARLGRELEMGGGGGVGDQAFGVAQIVGNVDQLERIGKLERGFLAALDLERDIPPPLSIWARARLCCG
jgi:hypothetical protein